jgi:hypothetical protein
MAKTPREYSRRRLAELDEALDPIRPLLDQHPLCVYATGSYGRLEAFDGSDVDLFFLYDGSGDADAGRFPWTGFIRLAACLIDATDRMGFPPFSGDGQYLDVLYVGEMERVLGSRKDDSLNAFTARMLLLLESQPLHNSDLYADLMERIVGFYYRDFNDHAGDFVPAFLQNDILRFWRTLTLNYEHHRLKLRQLVGDELEQKKAESALKNYKLKVSRLATCFSMVANLAAEEVPVRPETVLELCRLTPAERFGRLRDRGDAASKRVDTLESIYNEFLESVQRDEADVLADFGDDQKRREALGRVSAYGDEIYALLNDVAQPGRMRYLVI